MPVRSRSIVHALGSSIVFALVLGAVGARADSMTQALWVFTDELTTPSNRSTLVERSASAGVTDLYVSVYRSVRSSAGRQMYEDSFVADLIARAHARGQKVRAAYGAPDWPALGCSATSFPMKRFAEIVAYNAANPAARFDGVTLDVEPEDPQTEADFQSLLALYGCANAVMKANGMSLAVAIRFFWDKPVVFPGPATDLKPKNLLVYYGSPSRINGATSIASAAGEFAKYDYVVLGDGFEKTYHVDHVNTVGILSDSSLGKTTVFGYIDLGVMTQNLSMAEVKLRVDEWKATGARGIYFDKFGYLFATSRARQNEAVDYAHSKGMVVLVNASNPDEAFGHSTSAMNPYPARPTRLGPSDFYLYQGHQIQGGTFEAEFAWRTKAELLNAYQSAIGFKILSVTTNDTNDVYDESKFLYSWHSALLFGHEATGWGEYAFSADDAVAPFRARPAIDPGASFVAPTVSSGSLLSRNTSQGQVLVDTSRHDSGFVARPSGKPAYQHIIDMDLAHVVVMGYRDYAGNGCSSDGGIICLDQDEITYASDRGKYRRVLVGLDTSDCAPGCGPSKVTFFEEGQSRLSSQTLAVANHFAGSAGFGGFAIMGYRDSYLSGTAAWPNSR